MWWCCGKRSKEQPGCKFSKHEHKEDDEEEQTKEELEENLLKMKRYVRCLCCKEVGHTILDCKRDPNFRTDANIETDILRLNQIKDQKKLHVDTVVSTTHFMKKSVMIPVDQGSNGQMTEPNNTTHPFMRGIMTFDDFNYTQFNDYVLLEEPSQIEKQRLVEERKRLNTQKRQNADFDGAASTLSAENVLGVPKRKFKHELITIQPSE